MTTLAPTPISNTPQTPGSLPSSLKRSYEESEINDGHDQDASKRPRVAFDDNVDVRVFGGEDDSKPLEYIRDEVKRGLEIHLAKEKNNIMSEDEIYLQLVELFRAPATSDDAPSTTKLRKYLQALMAHVNSLDRVCSQLVHAVTDMQWLGRDEGFVGLFRQFLTLLLSAHGGCTGSVIKMLVKNFRGIPTSAGQLPGSPIVSKEQMSARLHATLRYLLSVLPSAGSVLSTTLSRLYPPSEESKKVHVNFAHQVLKLTEYAPELKSDILSTIVDRLIKIDVEVQVEMDRMDEDIEDSGILDTDDDEEDEDEDDDDMSDISLTEDEERIKNLRTSVSKIDAIMEILFTYYDSQIRFANDDDQSPTPEAEDTMEALLSLFASAILPKHRSRHTQFLVFHFAQRCPQFMDWFEGAAAHLTRDRTGTALARTNAADYLASFIARGKRIDASHITSVFDLLLTQCDELRDLHFRNAGPHVGAIRPDKTRYGLYYAYIQALLYIFCFRWRDLVTNADALLPPLAGEDDNIDSTSNDTNANPNANPNGNTNNGASSEHRPDLSEILEPHADDLRWARRSQPRMAEHVYGPLNPLKVCNAGIVQQFAHVGRATRFLYVYPLLSNNRKVRLHAGMGLGGSGLAGADGGGRLGAGVAGDESAGTGGGEAKYQLEAYFPFDPYLLPRSRKWLEGDYVEWTDVELWEDKVKQAAEEDEEEEGEDGEEGGEEIQDNERVEEAGGDEVPPEAEGQDKDTHVQRG
ncbi:MAG: hypothetical protein M1822_002546 [Bathelium mastoideum]|nr:MAG: hypothetical protein M1822_002546 [Bathelium mastoideum]